LKDSVNQTALQGVGIVYIGFPDSIGPKVEMVWIVIATYKAGDLEGSIVKS